MASFIDVTQVEPGVHRLLINVDYIVLAEPSYHADGGTNLIVKDGLTTSDCETGYKSYTVTYRVKENFQTIKRLILDATMGPGK